jgi:hypothetical protein
MKTTSAATRSSAFALGLSYFLANLAQIATSSTA